MILTGLATVDEILLLKFERRRGVSLRPAFFSAHRIYEVFSSYPSKHIDRCPLDKGQNQREGCLAGRLLKDLKG